MGWTVNSPLNLLILLMGVPYDYPNRSSDHRKIYSRKLLDALRACGYRPPLLTTPEELLEIMQ